MHSRQSFPLLLLPAPVSSASHKTPANFPHDVLLCIFHRLVLVRDVAAARRVCSTWRSLIDSDASIWKGIVFHLPKASSDLRAAETWFRKAADSGNAQAQFLLALLYTYGYSPTGI